MTAPTVYFIDDSATMREVIKIAFRRENIDVVACHDGETALTQMSQNPPDVVISDVIMPGKDGYEVCQSIKQNPTTSTTPVVLMSGVVNKQVAEKAFSVKADELIRKPFQPGDLIGRVKQLLNRGGKQTAPAPTQAPTPVPAPVPAAGPAPVPNANAMATLSSIFSAATRPAANGGNGGNGHGTAPAPVRFAPPAAAAVAATAASSVANGVAISAVASRTGTGGADVAKLKIEILRLEHLVKKLQSELEAEREYAHALEEHIKTLQETD